MKTRKTKKRLLYLLAAVALLLVCMITGAVTKGAMRGQNIPERSASLQFQQDGTFKIIQVSDLHETYFTGGITKDFLYDLARRERPDLFVLTGDNLSSRAVDWGIGFLSRYWVKISIHSFMDVFDRIYKDFGIPVTMVYGNHDAEFPRTSREEQFAIYASHRSFLGQATAADEGTQGKFGQSYGTHHLLIKDSAGQTPVFSLWLFDNANNREDDDGYGCVQKPQLDWFAAENEATGKLPSFVFQHIVVPEIYDLLTPIAQEDVTDDNVFHWDFVDENGQAYTKYIARTLPTGVRGQLNETPCPPKHQEGQYSALNEAGNVLAIFFGHEHTNTFELRRDGAADLVNSPSSGFGSHGSDLGVAGVRAITLDENDLSDYDTEIITYQGYYEGALRQARLKLFQSLRSFPNTILSQFVDIIAFRPLLRITKR